MVREIKWPDEDLLGVARRRNRDGYPDEPPESSPAARGGTQLQDPELVSRFQVLQQQRPELAEITFDPSDLPKRFPTFQESTEIGNSSVAYGERVTLALASAGPAQPGDSFAYVSSLQVRTIESRRTRTGERTLREGLGPPSEQLADADKMQSDADRITAPPMSRKVRRDGQSSPEREAETS